MKRSSGVLMHITTLFGDYSSGSFGQNAKKFIDFLEGAGFTYWQTLPFCMADLCNSPYKSFSAFSENPYFVDLEILYEKGYITKEDLEGARQKTPYSAEYKSLGENRLPLLLKASKNAPKDEVLSFISENRHIEDFCKFMALKEANEGAIWLNWKTEEINPDILFMWQFIEYEFFTQWMKIKEYANKKGIKIIGDMPMFVDLDSSDVYYNKDSFLLDEKGYPESVAGVPPDYFCADGQLWGNPLYDWDKMEKDGFSWWRDRFSYTLTLFDGVRIDHFRGLESYYAIPYGAENARGGKWQKAKGKEMLDAIADITKDKLVIAEDLGEITEEVIKLVKYSAFPNMRVMQFGFLSPEDSSHRFHNYENNSVAYTGTHDNNTLLGYVWEMSEAQRKMLFDYIGYEGDLDHCYDAIIRSLFMSSAGLVILPIQDILLFGNDTRMNVPGRPDGNWEYRITEDNLKSIDREKYRKLNTLYNRI